MKFKFKHIIATFALAGVMAIGVGAALNFRNASGSVSAATEKQVVVKFGSQGNWNQANAKLGVYLWNGSGSTWTNLVSLDSSKNIYVLNYTLEGTPDNLIISRQNSSATVGSFDTSWAKTDNLAFNEATYLNINGWSITSTSGWKVSADVRSDTVPSFGTKQVLSKIGLNDAGNPEVSGKVSLGTNEVFKMLSGDGVWTGAYSCPAGLVDYFENDSSANIVCKNGGDYDFYFDTEAKSLWITNDALVAADGWAREFLQDVKCDSTGSSVPTGWSTSASYYASISDDAKDLVYGSASNESGSLIEQALARYDYAAAHHSGLSRFVVNHSGAQRPVARIVSNPQTISEVTGTTTTVVVIAVTLVSVTAIVTYVFVRKRKEN